MSRGYHVRRVPAAEWPPVVHDPVTGAPHPATPQELRNMGLRVVGTYDNGDLRVDCSELDEQRAAQLPGRRVVSGYAERRHGGAVPHRWAGE